VHSEACLLGIFCRNAIEIHTKLVQIFPTNPEIDICLKTTVSCHVGRLLSCRRQNLLIQEHAKASSDQVYSE